MPEFSTKQREKLAEEKEAMPDGSYPIRNRSDLKNAIQAFGRAKNPEKTKAWIKRRARELDAEDLIPESWLEHSDNSDYLIHYGVLGMKWGVRRASGSSSGTKPSRKTRKEIKKINKSLSRNERQSNYYKNSVKSSQKGLADLKKNGFKSKHFTSSWHDGDGTWALPSGKGKNWLNDNFDDIDIVITNKPTKAQKQRGMDYIVNSYKKSVADGKKSLERLNKERNILNQRLSELNKKK